MNVLIQLSAMVNEEVISYFEDAVVECVVRITKDIIKVSNKEQAENELEEILTTDVWNKLSDESKTYLVTAKVNFETMIEMENRDELDFSGVCLLLTKTMDEEISKRFYTRYAEYLQEQYPLPENVDKWPKDMLNKYKPEVIDKKYFTLGTVRFVIGKNKDGKVMNWKSYNRIRRYARDYLYKEGISKEEREEKLLEIVKCIEIIRIDYRNPSAHRNALDTVKAEACMDYMLGTYKKLKLILEDMRI